MLCGVGDFGINLKTNMRTILCRKMKTIEGLGNIGLWAPIFPLIRVSVITGEYYNGVESTFSIHSVFLIMRRY